MQTRDRPRLERGPPICRNRSRYRIGSGFGGGIGNGIGGGDRRTLPVRDTALDQEPWRDPRPQPKAAQRCPFRFRPHFGWGPKMKDTYMHFDALELAIQRIRHLRPLVERLRSRNADAAR